MAQMPCYDYIDKIILLENFSQRKKKYNLTNPKHFDSKYVIVNIQEIAKKLSSNIGYDKLKFKIVFKWLEIADNINYNPFFNTRGTAGNIRLEDKEEVIINISVTLSNTDAILATLSHEMSHEYIYLNKLTLKNSYENEVFTDLTSIYLGFGKLMLNGVEIIKKTYDGNIERTSTKKVGYLNRDQLAFIYLAVNFSEGINNTTCYSHLNTEAFESVKKIEKEYHIFFESIKLFRNKMLKINVLRYKLAYLYKITNFSERKKSNEIKEFIRDEFTKLNLVENKFNKYKKEFLYSVLDDPKNLKHKIKEIPVIGFNDKDYKRFYNISKRNLTGKFKKSLISKEIYVTECLICNRSLRIKTKNIGIISCPNCHFKFAVDTLPKIGKKRIISFIKRRTFKIKVFFYYLKGLLKQ